MITKIISGGQTGVDRAALDFAIKFNIPYGGWCPKGRLDENGIMPNSFENLKEVPGEFPNDSDNYALRTMLNIRDSDATLILVPEIPLPGNIKDGTILTLEHVEKLKKQYLVINLSDDLKVNATVIYAWMRDNNIKNLNVAGPRESTSPGIYEISFNLFAGVRLAFQENEKLSSKKKCSL